MDKNQLKHIIKEEYHNVKSFMEDKYGFTPELGKVISNPYAKSFVNEVSEPEVISQLRDIVNKKQNKKIKDPKSGKMMRVDMMSASAVIAVYDALRKPNVKANFASQPLPKMVNVAFKVAKVRKENVAKNHDGKAAPYGSGYKKVNELLVIVDKFDKNKQDYGKIYYRDGGNRPGDGDIKKANKELEKLSKKHKGLTLVSIGRNSKMYDVNNPRESVNEEFKSKDSTFEKVYGIFDKRDYFNNKGFAKTQIGNFERALQKKDKGAQKILDKFKGDVNKAKDYIFQVLTDRRKEESFNDYKAFKAAVDSIQKGKPIPGAVDLVKRKIHNNSQKYTMALYSTLRNQKFNKWKDIHTDVDSLIGESLNEATFVPVSGTKAGGYLVLNNKKYQLKKDIKDVQIGNNYMVTLPKGTIIYNLPGGVLASHKSLEKYDSSSNRYFKKSDYSGIGIRQFPRTIKAIEKHSKILESLNEAKYKHTYKSITDQQKDLKRIFPSGHPRVSVKAYHDMNPQGKMKTSYVEIEGPSSYVDAYKKMAFNGKGTMSDVIKFVEKNESVNEAKSMDMKKRLKVYDKLKKGDKVTIKYGSSIRGGVEKEFEVSKGKTLVGKQKVERIILKNPANPKGVKYYLYQRNGNVTMAIGDMAATIEDMHESVNEAQKINSSSKKFLKGMKKIKVKGLGGYMPGVDYVYVDGDKYYFVDFEGDHMELKNTNTIKQLHKLHGSSLDESVNEGKKRYNVMHGVGKSKYVVNYHDGKKKHNDGSDFFDISTFKNKKDLAKKINDLHKSGYKYGFAKSVNEGVFSNLDLIRQNSKDARDFIKNVFKDDDFKDMKNDREFLKYLKSIYEGFASDAQRRAAFASGYKAKGKKGKKKESIEEYDVENYQDVKEFVEFMKEYKSDVNEAEYQGRDVKLGKIMQGDVKKFKVYVKNPKGNVVKVNFGHKGKGGEKTMRIKKSDPARRKAFRSRHNCDNPGPRHKARYWACRTW